MNPETTKAIDSLPARRGHFLLESGYHSDLWFSLDALFLDHKTISPIIDRLADLLRPFDLSAICGPLLGGAFLAQALAMRLGLRFYYTQREIQTQGNPGSLENELFTARYYLPGDLRQTTKTERVAIVDDVISAGSSVRATALELADAGATILAIGTIMLLGNETSEFFGQRGLPLIAVTKQEFNLWQPGRCPACADGVVLENPAGS